MDLTRLRQSIMTGLLVLSGMIRAQYVVSGFVVDDATSETLIGATVIEMESGRGSITDVNGFFSLAGLPEGANTLVVSFVGYQSDTLQLLLENSRLVPDIRLRTKVESMDEVSIVAVKPNEAADKEVETSLLQMTSKMIQSIPAAGNDVFSAIKYLPGIDRTEAFSPLFSVRGGDPGENAVMLDGVMIYNPYHASISAGIFNTQTIKSVDLLMGGFGAEYGGRNSSVLYIHTKDGNNSELHGEIEPSTFHSKAFLEFPVGRRGSAMVAGRYFYDVFALFLMDNTSYFYDLNLSYTLRINTRNRLTFKYFLSQDDLGFNLNTFYQYFGNTVNLDIYDDFDLNLVNRWSNQAATMIHKWVISPRLLLRSQVYYSSHRSENISNTDFRMEIPLEDDDTLSSITDTLRLNWQTGSEFDNRISDLTAKTSLNFRLARFNTLQLGAEINQYYFRNSARINTIDQGSLSRSPLQIAFFAEDKLQAGPLILRPGIRAILYDDYDWVYEPRFNLVLMLPAGLRLKAAWGEYNQFVISMNTNEVEMNQSVDYYLPLRNYAPSKSVHYIAGIEKSMGNLSRISLDVYYKDIQSVYTFNINETGNKILTLSDKLEQGSGEAYGAELILQGRFRNLSGWLSYGLTWANRSYPFLDGGKAYPYDYNRRHSFKLVANYAITKNLEYNTSFTLLSGNYRSIEQITQNYYSYDPQTSDLSMFPIWISNGKNKAKMPALMNWDMSIRKRLRTGFGKSLSDVFGVTESYLTVTIRNITFFRRNVEFYFPVGGIPRWEGKFLPFGTNYFPTVGLSYTLKF